MSEILLPYMLWFKALHIISFTAWMAGMFYLPRLFVYHVSQPVGSDADNLFRVMERRLLKVIINPAMISTFIFGILMLVANPELLRQGYMHAKFTLVLIMTAIHGFDVRYLKAFAKGENKKSEKFFRAFNEAPTLVFIAIVLLVVLKAF